MKCPKCGYLGFEATDRCRNCGYDFSLLSPSPSPDLSLKANDTDGPGIDLLLQDEPEEDALLPASQPTAVEAVEDIEEEQVPGADLPLFAPRPAGTPLAVRRNVTDGHRTRRPPRPPRPEAPVLPLLPDPPIEEAAPDEPVAAVRSSSRPRTAAPAGMGARLLAAAIDLVLLLAIDAGVLFLTLRLVGLDFRAEDLTVLPTIPLAAFMAVLAFLYLAGFSLGGGQTIGKMLTGIRVAGDDGRGVDMTGAVVRALGCLAIGATLGLAYLPVFFAADRRGMHDRLAGTRVVAA